jgi:hypothetical protein
MKTIILASAAALAFSLPAAAQIPFGVDTSGLSTADVIQLERAYEENDNTRINFILSGGSNLDAAEIERRGVAQAIARSVEQNEFANARSLAATRGSSDIGTTASTRGSASVPGWLQNVADGLGVDAGDFTRGELITLARLVEDDQHAAVTAFISRVVN